MLKQDKELLNKLNKVHGITYYLIDNNYKRRELRVIDNFSVYNLPTTTVQPTAFSPSGNAGNSSVVRFIPSYGAFVFVESSEIDKLNIPTILVDPWSEKVDVGIAAMAGLLK